MPSLLGVPASNTLSHISQEDTTKALTDSILECWHQEVHNLLQGDDPDCSYDFTVSLLMLSQLQPEVTEMLLQTPKLVTKQLSTALLAAQQLKVLQISQRDSTAYSIKQHVHVRLCPLPAQSSGSQILLQPKIGTIRTRHAQRLVTVVGTVIRTGAVNMLEASRLYECKKCTHRFLVEAELELQATVQLPPFCPAEDCRGSSFQHLKELQMHTEYQEIRVQEASHSIDNGGPPQAVTLLLMGSHADCCQPGEDIEVVGTVLQQWRPPFPGVVCDTSLVVLVNNMTTPTGHRASASVSSEDAALFQQFWEEQGGSPLACRNQIVQAVCPQLYGAFIAKLALLLTLVGGIPCCDDDGGCVRGEIHMLLVGDPATGKSQLLRRAALLSQRAVSTSGRGATGAGLTATAVRDGSSGAWALEAGALVLADGGLLCLDELEGLRDGDATALHEAMEQQTVSIAKAGMVTSLPARASVLASVAPQRAYNPQESLAKNTGLTGPMLSRFDVALVLRDAAVAAWDAEAADHVLDGQPGSLLQQDKFWTVARLRAYIVWAKEQFEPSTSSEAEAVLLWYYSWRRGSSGRCAARTTIRMLQGLLRLAQAHARIMARKQVLQQDAIIAIAVVEASVHEEFSLLGGQDALRTLFPRDPDKEYVQLEAHVLDLMQMGSQQPDEMLDDFDHDAEDYTCDIATQ